MSRSEVRHVATVTVWAHGKARVRLDGGTIEFPATPSGKLRGQLSPGERVWCVLSPDGTVGRIVERVEEQGRVRFKASERRRQKIAGEKPSGG
jgi:hypothetical protein